MLSDIIGLCSVDDTLTEMSTNYLCTGDDIMASSLQRKKKLQREILGKERPKPQHFNSILI